MRNELASVETGEAFGDGFISMCRDMGVSLAEDYTHY